VQKRGVLGYTGIKGRGEKRTLAKQNENNHRRGVRRGGGGVKTGGKKEGGQRERALGKIYNLVLRLAGEMKTKKKGLWRMDKSWGGEWKSRVLEAKGKAPLRQGVKIPSVRQKGSLSCWKKGA